MKHVLSVVTVGCAAGVVGLFAAGLPACSSSSNGGGDGSGSGTASVSSSTSAGHVGSNGSASSSSGRASDTSGGGSTSGSTSTSRGNTTSADAGESTSNDAGETTTEDAGDGSDPLAAARALCLQIINQDRASLSPASPALTEDTAEESCVDMQAQADYTANTAHSASGMCKEQAQDECPDWGGTPTEVMTKCLAQMWAEGPPEAGIDNHWLNMSNKRYTKVACGFYQTPSGSWWATQDFWP